MSQENVEIVRAAIDAWNRRDFDSLMNLVHEDVEFSRSPAASRASLAL
jgi:ketosteroid isomerase-like protein